MYELNGLLYRPHFAEYGNIFPSSQHFLQAHLINHTFLYKNATFYRYTLSNYLDTLTFSKFIAVTATTIITTTKKRLANYKYFILIKLHLLAD